MIETVERTLYYYEFGFKLLKHAEESNRNYLDAINKIISYCDVNSDVRFIKKREQDENKLGVYQYHLFEDEPEKIGLKFIRLRKDVFPQLMDDENTNLEDLVDANNKSVVESTHIILDYEDHNILRVGIEYNNEGPKISDFIIYMKRLGRDLGLIRSISVRIIANDKLEEVANKIGKCRFLQVKVLRENVDRVKKHDVDLGNVLDSLSKFSKNKYFTVKLRLDYEKSNLENKKKIFKFIDIFSKNKNELDVYDGFTIDAEDTSKPDNRFESFNLLMDKVKSTVKPERKHNSKVIISGDMFNLMLEEYKYEIN